MRFPFCHHVDPPSRPSGAHICGGPTRTIAVHAEAGLTIVVASTRRARLRGLAGLCTLPRDHALLLERCRSVHTAGMRFSLDLLWLDGAGSLVRLDRCVAPRRLRSCARARAVLECNAGEGDRLALMLAAPRHAAAGRVSPSAGSGKRRCELTTDGDFMPGNGDSELRDQPIADLVKQLTEQTKVLARQEIELAKAELSEKGKKAGLGVGMFGGAGLFGFFAFAVLTACFVLLLDTAMQAWLAALIVAVAYGAIAGVLALSGKKQVQEATPPAPQTVETVKEDVQWTKQRAQAGRN